MEPRALGAALLTLLFWASAFAAIRAGLEGLEPGHLVLLRFLVAGALLLLYALLRGFLLRGGRTFPAFSSSGSWASPSTTPPWSTGSSR